MLKPSHPLEQCTAEREEQILDLRLDDLRLDEDSLHFLVYLGFTDLFPFFFFSFSLCWFCLTKMKRKMKRGDTGPYAIQLCSWWDYCIGFGMCSK